MARIVHIALKVEDLERSTQFYEDVFGLHQTGTVQARGHVARHMTDGALDVALMAYDGESASEAQFSGAGPCIHHWGIEVEDLDEAVAAIEANGGTILSERGEGALKFRAPDGTVAEIVAAGRDERHARPDRPKSAQSRIVHLAIKVGDLEAATRFYEAVFGFTQLVTGHNRQHFSRHMTDGTIDLALMVYDSEDVPEAQLAGPGPCIHHWGLEVADREVFAARIEQHGGEILSRPQGAGAVKFRAPDGTLAEIVRLGSFERLRKKAVAARG